MIRPIAFGHPAALLTLVALVLADCSRPSLAGRWVPQSAELGGVAFPVASFNGATLLLTDSSYDFAGDKGSYTRVSSTSPAAMDIHGSEGPNAGRTIQAIYQVAGDQLTICYQLGAGARPGAFASPKGSQVLLVHYKRAS